MKLQAILTIAIAAITASAAPADTDAAAPAAIAADNCFHPSSCSRTWGGKCEDYCDKRGFSHMTGDNCGWLKKKCCCIKK